MNYEIGFQQKLGGLSGSAKDKKVFAYFVTLRDMTN